MRRDEAAAKAAEEAEEQRMQEVDAERQLAILRGEVPPPLPEPEETKSETAKHDSSAARPSHSSGSRRKRKRPGEDDTEFELRLANERNEPFANSLEVARKPTSSAPITDRSGHIDLFGDERARAHGEKNEEAEKESKKKRQEFEDQYTMRFTNAAGKDGLGNPWYSHPSLKAVDRPSKDAFGNEDPRRKERDVQRTASSDPLAMMKKGASKVRELKQERKKFQEERDEELRQLRKEQHRRERRSREQERSRDRSPRGSDRRRRRSKDRHDEHRERRRHRDGADDRQRRRRSRSPEYRRHRHRHEL